MNDLFAPAKVTILLNAEDFFIGQIAKCIKDYMEINHR